MQGTRPPVRTAGGLKRRVEMRKWIYTGALTVALAAGAAAISGGPLLPGAATPAKVTPAKVTPAKVTPAKVAQASNNQRVATLSVVNVSCITCAPIVTQALTSVPGVADVAVKEGSGATATVRVVYDPAKTTPAALAAATSEAGYPAEVAKN